MTTSEISNAAFSGTVEAWGKGGPAPDIILICEHASNQVATPWEAFQDGAGATGLMASHAAYDPGALGLARALGAELAGTGALVELVHAPLSRLIYDLNRSPDRPDACPEQSEIYLVAANQGLSADERLARVEQLYLPFHNLLRGRIARALALGVRPVVISVHSFAPLWHGVPRPLEFGVIHDALPALAEAIVASAAESGFVCALNAPYSAADHVTHTLRLHALPYGLDNAMLELRNDLIASPRAQQDMAARLAPVLRAAIAQVAEVPCPAQ